MIAIEDLHDYTQMKKSDSKLEYTDLRAWRAGRDWALSNALDDSGVHGDVKGCGTQTDEPVESDRPAGQGADSHS